MDLVGLISLYLDSEDSEKIRFVVGRKSDGLYSGDFLVFLADTICLEF